MRMGTAWRTAQHSQKTFVVLLLKDFQIISVPIPTEAKKLGRLTQNLTRQFSKIFSCSDYAGTLPGWCL